MKKFFKKPLNIVSLVLAVLGLVGMIVILCVPHGGTYTYTKKEDGKKYKAIVQLKDGNLYSNYAIDGEWASDENEKVGKYRITDGNLSYSVTGTAYVDYAKINAFKITITGSDEMTYTCTASVTFFIIACVMLAVGASGMIYGAVAKPKKKKK